MVTPLARTSAHGRAFRSRDNPCFARTSSCSILVAPSRPPCLPERPCSLVWRSAMPWLWLVHHTIYYLDRLDPTLRTITTAVTPSVLTVGQVSLPLRRNPASSTEALIRARRATDKRWDRSKVASGMGQYNGDWRHVKLRERCVNKYKGTTRGCCCCSGIVDVL